MKYLSVVNLIRYYVDDFCCDLTYVRKDYINRCRNLTKRIEKLYFDSLSNDDFVCKLYDELLASRNDIERKLFSGLIFEIRRLRKYDLFC